MPRRSRRTDQIGYGRFTELEEITRLQLKQILEQAAVPSPVRSKVLAHFSLADYVAADHAPASGNANDSDPHAPDEYRTNSVLQDLPEFGKSFSCKKTAPMVSDKPCRIW